MKNINSKELGENFGMVMVSIGAAMLLTPMLKMIAYIGSVVYSCF